jgi:hypothetical protein
MKNQNKVFTASLVAIAFAFAPVLEAAAPPDGGPAPVAAAVTIHSTDNVIRGKTGSFVLAMTQSTSGAPYLSSHPYVNFSVSGTAIQGVDYVAIVSPTLIGASGYGTILVKTLPDPRAGSARQSYSVVVTMGPGAGYSVGQPSTATMWIKPCVITATGTCQ